VSIFADLSGLRYFFRMDFASGFVCESSSMNGTRRGQALL